MPFSQYSMHIQGSHFDLCTKAGGSKPSQHANTYKISLCSNWIKSNWGAVKASALTIRFSHFAMQSSQMRCMCHFINWSGEGRTLECRQSLTFIPSPLLPSALTRSWKCLWIFLEMLLAASYDFHGCCINLRLDADEFIWENSALCLVAFSI